MNLTDKLPVQWNGDFHLWTEQRSKSTIRRPINEQQKLPISMMFTSSDPIFFTNPIAEIHGLHGIAAIGL